MNGAVTRSGDAIIDGRWTRDRLGRVVMVVCRCGQPIVYENAIHSRLVRLDGAALCKNCRSLVRVPVAYLDPAAAPAGAASPTVAPA